MIRTWAAWGALVCVGLSILAGCDKLNADKPKSREVPANTAGANNEVRESDAPKDSLSPEDQKLADAQKLCPISNEELGSMGAPVKLMLDGKPVFLCCEGCRSAAEKDPDGTLAKLQK